MDKDIERLIEEEVKAYTCSVIKNEFNPLRKYTANDLIEEIECAVEYVSKFILSKWQEAERWRKFTTDDLPNLGMRILLKNGNRLDVTVVHSHQHIHELAECFTEWKPMS